MNGSSPDNGILGHDLSGIDVEHPQLTAVEVDDVSRGVRRARAPAARAARRRVRGGAASPVAQSITVTAPGASTVSPSRVTTRRLPSGVNASPDGFGPPASMTLVTVLVSTSITAMPPPTDFAT